MPEAYRKIHAHPFQKIRSLDDAAKDGQIIQIKCNLCRRHRNYLASDLAAIAPQGSPADTIPFTCSRCGTKQYMTARFISPEPSDYGQMIIRKLSGIISVATWKDKRLGDI